MFDRGSAITVLGLAVLAAPLLLLAVLGLSSLLGRRLSEEATGRLCQSAIVTGLLAALGVLALMLLHGTRHETVGLGEWVGIPHYHFSIKLVFDRLSVPFAILTFLLCGTIAAFATRYMHREPGFNRFFVLYALFVAGMVLASLAGTIETLFAGWELVGLSSALLVAYFQERPGPVRNGLRVWVVYRISDAALLLAAIVLHHLKGQGDFDRLLGVASWPDGEPAVANNAVVLVGFLLIVAAAGKSALIPFSGWLPRAMEGPTPSSAIFYGALSVHLGAFLLLRISPLLETSLWLSGTVVVLGLSTAAYAYLAGAVQTDIKSVLSFASLVQVGLIVAEIGLGLRYIALVHLLGNACLRTLQFVRAPTLLHDYHLLENAIGDHWPRSPGNRQPKSGRFRIWLYRFGLERGYLDSVLNDYIVAPFARFFRACDRLERAWTNFLSRRSTDGESAVRRPGANHGGPAMNVMPLPVPWLELAIVVAAAGALVVSPMRAPLRAWRWGVLCTGMVLLCTVLASADFYLCRGMGVETGWSLQFECFGRQVLEVDELNAPLLPMVALLHFLIALATGRTKMRRFSLSWSLTSEAICLATFGAAASWVLVGLLIAGTLPGYVELRNRGRSTRVYVLHMALFAGLLSLGWAFAEGASGHAQQPVWAILPLLAAVLIRCGTVPVHCWVTDWLENASFGNALLFVTPLPGVYAAVRLVLPIAPEWVLSSIALVSLITAVYAAALAVVQHDARRFFAYLFVSHASLVLIGLELHTVTSLTGALALWISVSLSLAGFGLTLRALEARYGRMSLTGFHGLYDHSPALAICFALTGLASVGFPGTLGFVATDLLIDGVVEASPHVGPLAVLAAALNGIAVVRAYLHLFTGARHVSTVSLGIGPREQIAVLTLAALILGGGLFPQPGIASRHEAALTILADRDARLASEERSVSSRDPGQAQARE